MPQELCDNCHGLGCGTCFGSGMVVVPESQIQNMRIAADDEGVPSDLGEMAMTTDGLLLMVDLDNAIQWGPEDCEPPIRMTREQYKRIRIWVTASCPDTRLVFGEPVEENVLCGIPVEFTD